MDPIDSVGDSIYDAGTRVRIAPEHDWAQGVLGTASEPRDIVREIVSWAGVSRVVESLRGPIVFYWVNFDTPQEDSEGHGPIFGAEVDAAYLRLGPPPTGPKYSVSGQIEVVWYGNEELGLKVELKALHTKPRR